MFAIHGNLLPSVSSYEEAVALYEKTSESKKLLPFGAKSLRPNSRDTSKLINRRVDMVEFIFHQTSLVRWQSPDEVEVYCHHSVSSRVFIGRFLPYGLYALSYQGDTTINGYRPKEAGITFRRKAGVWTPDPDDLANEETYKVDLKRAAAIRKLLKPVLEWGRALETLSGKQIACHPSEARHYKHEMAQALSLTTIPTESYRRVMQLVNHLDLDCGNAMDAALAIGGAIKKTVLPPGTMPAKTKWEKFEELLPDPII